jgi:hypothetical protein
LWHNRPPCKPGVRKMDYLTIAVIAIAVAQALTVLFTIGREREIARLRDLVTQQRIIISEIRGWLMRDRIEPRRIKSEPIRGPRREPIANDMKEPEPATTPKDLHERPRLTEDEIKEMVGVDKAREIVAVLHGKPPPEKIG